MEEWARLLEYGVLGIFVFVFGLVIYKFVIKRQSEEIDRLQALSETLRTESNAKRDDHAEDLKALGEKHETALKELQEKYSTQARECWQATHDVVTQAIKTLERFNIRAEGGRDAGS